MGNQQSLKVINKAKGKFTKPSEILQWAKNQPEIKWVKKRFNDGNCGYCARGLIMQYNNNLTDDIFLHTSEEILDKHYDSNMLSYYKYGKSYKELTSDERTIILKYLRNIEGINDSSDDVDGVISYLRSIGL